MAIAPIRLASGPNGESTTLACCILSGRAWRVTVSLIAGKQIFTSNAQWSADDDLFGIEDIDQACQSLPHGMTRFLKESIASISPASAACLISGMLNGAFCSAIKFGNDAGAFYFQPRLHALDDRILIGVGFPASAVAAMTDGL
jgi:hypothetical protein